MVAGFTQAASDYVGGLACRLRVGGGEGADPGQGEAVAQDRLQVLPRGRPARRAALPLRRLDSRPVGEDGVDLDGEHHGGEDEAVQSHQEEVDERALGLHGGAQVPLAERVGAQGGDAEQQQHVQRGQRRVEREEQEELPVVLAHAVVDPRAVVVPPADAAPAHAAVVSAWRLDGAAERAAGAAGRGAGPGQGASGQGAWVSEHGPRVRRQGQEGQQVEERAVCQGVGWAPRREQPRAQQHDPLAQHQQPRGHGTRKAQGVQHEPHAGRVGRGAHLGGARPAGPRVLQPQPLPAPLACRLVRPLLCSRMCPQTGLCEPRKGGPRFTQEDPFPATSFLFGGEQGSGPQGRQRG